MGRRKRYVVQSIIPNGRIQGQVVRCKTPEAAEAAAQNMLDRYVSSVQFLRSGRRSPLAGEHFVDVIKTGYIIVTDSATGSVLSRRPLNVT